MQATLLMAKPSIRLSGLNDDSSLCKSFHATLFLLDRFDQNEIDALSVAYYNNGPYFDAALGPNWWEYYFSPIHLQHNKPTSYQILPHYEKSIIGHRAMFELPLERKRALFKKYIKFTGPIISAAQDFEKRHFEGHFVISVDYHSANHPLFQPKISFEEIEEAIRKQIHKDPSFVLFVSTNNKSFLSFIKERFEGHVVYTELMEQESKSKAQNALASLISARLMAQSEVLIRTGSGLSLMVPIFADKKLITIDLAKHWLEDDTTL